jgi:hypothetical protein
MVDEQTPAAAVFHKCVGKLKLEIERLPAGDSFCVRFPFHNVSAKTAAIFVIANVIGIN